MAATDRKVLAICIGAAFIFWLILNLSENYDIRREIQLAYTVEPERVVEGENIPDRLEADVTGKGWDLIVESLRPGPLDITVDLSGETSYQLNYADLVQRIRRRLSSGDLTVANLTFESTTLYTAPKSGKRVPVVARVKATFAPGHASIQPRVIVPDSITLSGSDDDLEEFDRWYTEPLILAAIDGNISTEIPLQRPPKDLSIVLSQETVNYELIVESVIQRTITVPVRIINGPEEEGRYRLVPETVDLQVTIPQSAYTGVRASDFRLVADLAELRQEAGRNSVPIKLIGQPEVVSGVFFSPRAVEYYLVN